MEMEACVKIMTVYGEILFGTRLLIRDEKNLIWKCFGNEWE